MDFINNLEGLKLNNSVITIGKFDGFHIGHIKLFDTAVSKKEPGDTTVIFMLDAKPKQIEGGSYAGDIFSLYEKQHFSYPSQIDKVILFHFDKAAMSMSPEDFVRKILLEQLGAVKIVVGFDFAFGKNRAGNVDVLKNLGLKYGFSVTAVSEVSYKGSKVSSTRIKEELLRLNLSDVNAMLGRPYSITGKVIKGNKLGRKIGFPTINMEIPAEKLVPPHGGYATKVNIDGKTYLGMSNIGVKPTVQESGSVNLETHIIDFEEDLYGRTLTVEFYEYIRPEIKFKNTDELSAALRESVLFVRKGLNSK